MQTTNEKQRSKRSREFWARHIQKCSESGLTQKEYCLRNGIGPKSMVYWKSKLKKETSGVSFVQLPVPVISNRAKPTALKLVYGDKYRIEVGDDFSTDTLKRLIHTIEDL